MRFSSGSGTTLVTDINIINQVIHIYTNVVSKINQTQEMFPDYGKVWYDDKSIVNIFSLTNLVNKYIVTYEAHQDYYFVVHTNIWIIKYRINKKVIYVFKPTYNKANSNVVTTVEENMVEFTSRQIYRDNLSRKIYSNSGLPMVNNFNHMFSTNMISNFPISVSDISNAENIYGPYMESLKGKSTRSKPRPVIKDEIQILSEIYKNNSNI